MGFSVYESGLLELTGSNRSVTLKLPWEISTCGKLSTCKTVSINYFFPKHVFMCVFVVRVQTPFVFRPVLRKRNELC